MTKTLRMRLQEAASSETKADRVLSSYMLAEMVNLPFETAASLASKVAVSEPTVGRFCRALGFKSFKDLKNTLRFEMDDQPWLIGDRLRDLRERSKAGDDQLTRGLELEMAALVSVYETAHTPEWNDVVKRLARVKAVFVAGLQTERGIAQIFAHQMQYIRDKVHLLDLADGNFSDILASNETDIALVIFEARRYSRNAQLLARESRDASIPVTLITDPYCDWGHQVADELFVVPTSFNLFLDSTAQMASLANLLVNAVFVELGPGAEARMKKVAGLYGTFTGHVDEPSHSKTRKTP